MGIDEGEFESTREYVEWYFGDLIDTVSTERPISRPRLVSALVKLHVSAVRREGFILERCETSHRTESERILWMPLSLWETLERSQDLTAIEAAAAREVHWKMAASIEGSLHTPRPETEPFVLLPSDG